MLASRRCWPGSELPKTLLLAGPGRGLAGTITYTPGAMTVRLDPPRAPRVARALALLIDEINHTPPAMPGDRRPVTYHLTANPGP